MAQKRYSVRLESPDGKHSRTMIMMAADAEEAQAVAERSAREIVEHEARDEHDGDPGAQIKYAAKNVYKFVSADVEH